MIFLLKIRFSAKFRKDVKLAQKRGLPIEKLKAVVEALCREEKLAPKHRDHALTGEWRDFRECHIQPDWLLIYRIEHEELTLIAQRTGTHSDLFSM